MASKSNSATQKANYKTYQSEERHAKNTVRKLERHVAKMPNDVQAVKALDALIENGVTYTRNRKAIKANDTVQKRVRRVSGYSTTQNTFYKAIEPAVPTFKKANQSTG